MNAQRDDNRKTTLIGLDATDGTTIKNVYADPSTHSICVQNGTTGSDLGNNIAIDENHIPIGFAVSSSDGKTPVAIYVNGQGRVLIQST